MARLPNVAQITHFAAQSASLLLHSPQGRAAGYWEKPLFGRPRVTGSAYVIGSYTYFILGCALAGVTAEPLTEFGEPRYLPDAQSLAAYYLEFPPVKRLLEAHFQGVEKYASDNLSPELRKIVGDTREMIENSGVGRPDENLMSIVWSLIQEGKPFPIEQAIESFTTTFLYGASMHPLEVDRLWGIQVQTTIVPAMEESFVEAQRRALSEVQEMMSSGPTP